MSVNRVTQYLLSAYGNRISGVNEGASAQGVRGGKGKESGSGEGMKADDVALSEGVRILQRVQRHLATVPDVREERVAQLREQIQNGTYQVSNERLVAHLFALGLAS